MFRIKSTINAFVKKYKKRKSNKIYVHTFISIYQKERKKNEHKAHRTCVLMRVRRYAYAILCTRMPCNFPVIKYTLPTARRGDVKNVWWSTTMEDARGKRSHPLILTCQNILLLLIRFVVNRIFYTHTHTHYIYYMVFILLLLYKYTFSNFVRIAFDSKLPPTATAFSVPVKNIII